MSLKAMMLFGTVCISASMASADCTTGSAGQRCFENGKYIWYPKTGGKCMQTGSQPGGGIDIRQNIICINSTEDSASVMNGNYEGGDTPAPENAVHEGPSLDDHSDSTWDI